MKIAVPPNVHTSGSRLVPSLRYRDVEAAIGWLCDAFGFEERNVVNEIDGSIRHAQLTFGDDMLMLLPASPSGASSPDKQPEDSGGAETQSLYFVVDDAEAHYLRAKAAGADILENEDYAFGGRGFSCRDLEGHVWHFGTYNPRQEGIADGVWIREFLYGNRARSLAGRLREGLNPPVLLAAVVASIVAAATVGWMLVALPQTSASAKERGPAFRAMLPPQGAETGVRVLARAHERTKAHAPAAQSQSAAQPVEDASERPGQPATETARLSGWAMASIGSPQRTDEAAERAARQAAEQAAEEALKKSRAAQGTAAQAFRQLRAARKAAAAAKPGLVEAHVPVATVSPESREQQAARERAAKEAAAKEAAAKAAAEAERWKVSTAQPTKAAARSGQEQNARPQAGWDCVPSPPSGEIACHPLGKKPAAAKASAAARQNLFAVEIVVEPTPEQRPSPVQKQPQEQRRPQEKEASARFWDCQPSPPDGQIICRPTTGRSGSRTHQ
ncbi:MAG TPA: VOC family protein [Hyphomicrobiaceae bacterium]|nr:VOC family protein [Hyphomicrobiaceae bacterium]